AAERRGSRRVRILAPEHRDQPFLSSNARRRVAPRALHGFGVVLHRLATPFAHHAGTADESAAGSLHPSMIIRMLARERRAKWFEAATCRLSVRDYLYGRPSCRAKPYIWPDTSRPARSNNP